jgi:CHC2 zinc finger
MDDAMVAVARSIRLESEIARRGIKLAPGVAERCGPCPVCGGTDRFSINLKKQVWNCRGCSRGGDVIALVQHIDGSDFIGAVERLAGTAPPAVAKRIETKLAPKKIIVESFDYRDENGDLLFQVQRVEYQNPDGSYVFGKDGKRKKSFPQRRPDPDRPGEWINNTKGVRQVLYRLPELGEALAHGRTVVLVEGEAKADLLWRRNIPATCSPMGAKNWRADLYAATLRGADIVVMPDNDPDGRLYLDTVAYSLKEVGARVRILDLPGLGPKGDVINWEAAGGTVEQLHALIDSDARPWAPSERESVNAEKPLLREQKPPSRVIAFTPYVW